MGGYSLYVENSRPVFLYNYFGADRYFIRSSEPLTPGKVSVRLEFKRSAGPGALATLFLNERKVAEGRVDTLTSRLYEASDVFNIGLDEGSRVSDEYGVDNGFTGKIARVIFDVQPEGQ